MSKCCLNVVSLKHISTLVIWGPKLRKCSLLPREPDSLQHTSTPVMWEPKMNTCIVSPCGQGLLKNISTSVI